MKNTSKQTKSRWFEWGPFPFILRLGFYCRNCVGHFIAILAIISISGLTPSFTIKPITYNYEDHSSPVVARLLAGTWGLVIGAVIGITILAILVCIERNWWFLAIKIEAIKESRLERLLFGVGCCLVLATQIYAWVCCQTEVHTCFDASSYLAPDTNQVSMEKYQDLLDFTKTLDCKDYPFDAIEVNSSQDSVDLDTYQNLQRVCYDISQHCHFVCENANASKISFAFSVLVSIGTLIRLSFYNGPYYEDIPAQQRAFAKLRLPTLYGWIPKFWVSSADLIQSLPIMVLASKTGLQSSISRVKHDDLEWGWVQDFTEEDFNQLGVLLTNSNL